MANQYTGLDEREYNGWPNRSTWDIALHRSNEYGWEKEYERIVDQVAGKRFPPLSPTEGWRTVKALYRVVWESAAKDDGCIWKNIDWDRLVNHFLEDVEDAKR